MTVDNILENLALAFSSTNIRTFLFVILLITLGFLLFGGVMRLVFGHKSTIASSTATAVGTIVLYSFVVILLHSIPYLARFHFSLPFLEYSHDALHIYSSSSLLRSELSSELLQLVVLVSIFGLFDELLPKEKNIFLWGFYRVLVILVTVICSWLLNYLLLRLLPDTFTKYMTVALIILLAIFLAVTIFKWLIGTLIGISVGPVLGAIYTFFISNILGKMLTKAAITSSIFLALTTLFVKYDIHYLSVSAMSWVVVLPILLLLSIIWYIIGRFT